MRLILAVLLLAGCADPIARAQAAEEEECAPTSTRILEAQMADLVEAAAPINVGVLVERDDGRRAWLVHGTPNARYISSSTAKPVAVSVMLWAVAEGHLSLDSRAADLVPDLALEGPERDVTLRHLLSFTSGLTAGPACWDTATDWAAYVACVDTLPTYDPERTPGVAYAYSTRQLDIASLMVIAATGAPDWATLFAQWRTATGLFPGVAWSGGGVIAAGREIMITAAEYADFLDAIQSCATLPDTPAGRRLCVAMRSDQIAWLPGTNTTTMQAWTTPSGAWWGEDWHFGFGLWLECASSEWHCDYAHKIATIGNAGQYAMIEREHRYRIVVTPSFGTNPTTRGAVLARQLAPLLETWASLAVQP